MKLIESLSKAILGNEKSNRAIARSRGSQPRGRRLRVESLENRNLMAGVVFDSLTGIGNGTDSTQAFAIEADQVGNSYVTGRFSGTVDFEPNLTLPNGSDTRTANGISDIFVAKYAASGSLTWVIQMGGGDAVNQSDWGRNIKVAPSGDVFVGGEFTGSATFGNQTLVSAGASDAFITKINANGLIQWSKNWGTSAYDGLLGVDVDSSGNVLVASNRTNDDLTVKKFSTNGTEVWTKNIQANSGYVGQGDLAVDGSGNVFVSAHFIGTVDFDPSNKTKLVAGGNSSLGIGNGYVLSLNSSGNFRWVSPFLARTDSTGHRGFASPTSLDIDNQGNVLVGGYRSGLVDFQASSATYEFPADRGGFLINLSNTSGYLRWAKSFDGTGGTAYVDDINVDAAGSIYLAGAFSGSVDFDPGTGLNAQVATPGTGATDAYYMKLGSSGDPIWIETLGDTGSDWARGIAIDGTGAVHVAGMISPGSAPVDFDPDPLSHQELSTSLKAKGFRLRMRQQ